MKGKEHEFVLLAVGCDPDVPCAVHCEYGLHEIRESGLRKCAVAVHQGGQRAAWSPYPSFCPSVANAEVGRKL